MKPDCFYIFSLTQRLTLRLEYLFVYCPCRGQTCSIKYTGYFLLSMIKDRLMPIPFIHNMIRSIDSVLSTYLFLL